MLLSVTYRSNIRQLDLFFILPSGPNVYSAALTESKLIQFAALALSMFPNNETGTQNYLRSDAFTLITDFSVLLPRTADSTDQKRTDK